MFNTTANHLLRRFDARVAAGVVSRAGLSTLIGEFVQGLAGVSGHSNPKIALPPNNRGGQYGNENRRIHGIYSGESLTISRDARDLASAIAVCEKQMDLARRKRHS